MITIKKIRTLTILWRIRLIPYAMFTFSAYIADNVFFKITGSSVINTTGIDRQALANGLLITCALFLMAAMEYPEIKGETF